MTHPGILAAKGIRPREGSLFGDTVSTIVQFNVQDKSVLYGMPLEPQIVYLRRMPGSFQIHHKSPNRPSTLDCQQPRSGMIGRPHHSRSDCARAAQDEYDF